MTYWRSDIVGIKCKDNLIDAATIVFITTDAAADNDDDDADVDND